MAGSAKRVSRTPPSSRGLRIRFCSRLRMRSMSRTPLSRLCSSVARPGAVTNSPTQFWRRLISSRSSSGAQSHRSSKRAPGAVTVPSIAARREPWRVLAADLKISKLRRSLGRVGGSLAAVFFDLSQILGLGAEGLGGVVDECASRSKGGVILIDTEAFKVHYPECFHHGLGAT